MLSKKSPPRATSDDMLTLIDHAIAHLDTAADYEAPPHLDYYEGKVALEVHYCDAGVPNKIGCDAATRLREIMKESVARQHKFDPFAPRFERITVWGLDTHILTIESRHSMRLRAPSKEALGVVLHDMREIVTQRAAEIDAPEARKR